jgi:hypothetical protein
MEVLTDPANLDHGGRGRLGAALEVTSLVFLVASFRWAHHWGPLADTIVFVWAASWIGGFGVSVWALKTSDEGRGFAKAGILIALVMCAVLVATGVAYAAGADPMGSCGGG